MNLQNSNESKTVLEIESEHSESDYDSEVSEMINSNSKTKCVIFTYFFIYIIIGILLSIPLIILTNMNKKGWINNLKNLPQNEEEIQEILIRLFTFIISTYFIFLLFSYIVTFIPRIIIITSRIISGNPSEITKQRLEFYIALIPTLKNTIMVCLSMTLWAIIYKSPLRFDEKEKLFWFVNILKCWACLTSAAIIICFEKVFVKLMALNFHRTAYKDRLKQSKYESKILDKLNGARKEKRYFINSPIIIENNKKKLIYDHSCSSSSISSSPNLLGKHDHSMSSVFNNFNHKFFDGKYDHNIDLNSKFNAKKLARKLFSALNDNRNYLLVEDFIPYFDTKKEAMEAFNVFDQDSNNDVTRKEMKEKIIQIYKERKDLSLALQDMSHAVGQLDRLLICFLSFFIILIWTLIFGKNLAASIVPFGTLFLGLSFVFGNTAKNVFESIIFLFIMHPFDAGDRVYIEKDNFQVISVGLLGTTFERTDGQYIYIPNSILITKYIYNIRRSTYQAEQIDFQLSFDTSKEKIFLLKTKICKYLEEEECRDFYPNPIFALDKMEDSNKLHMFIWLEHKSNWQEGYKRWARKTRFMFALKEICQELKLGYIPLELPITSKDSTITISTNEQLTTKNPKRTF